MGTKKIEEKQEKKGEKKYKYRTDGSGYDIGKMAPEAHPGEYIMNVKHVEMMPTKKDSYPMMVISWQIAEAVTDSDKCKKSEKAFITDRIVFWPESAGQKGNPAKRQLRQLCSHLDIDMDIIPNLKDGANDEDFEELLEAVKEAGQEVTVWVTHKKDKETDEMRANVQYVAPRNTAASKDEDEDEESDDDDSDDEDEDEKPKKKKRAEKDEDPDDDDDDDDDSDDDDDDDSDDDDDDDEEDEKPKTAKKKKSTRH
jgi:hypothetical protein